MGTTFRELPPRATGNSVSDLNNLRDYLIRMTKSLQAAQTAIEASNSVSGTSISSKAATSAAVAEAMQQNTKELRSLITKTATTLEQYTDTKTEQLSSTLVAKSEFGTYLQTEHAYIEATAAGTVESYNYGELITTAQTTATNAANAISSYETLMNGEIRRGVVTDPETGTSVMGIAIAQNLQFTGTSQTGADGNIYYTLQSGQTFGLYTSTGWQFWIDGYKKGWYNSTDGMLHITDVYIEKTLQLGEKVQFKVDPDGRFGIKLLT